MKKIVVLITNWLSSLTGHTGSFGPETPPSRRDDCCDSKPHLGGPG